MKRLHTPGQSLEIIFPIQVKQMTKEETKDYHRKKLYDLSLKSLGELAQLDEPTDEQKEWVLFRLFHPETWTEVHENKTGISRIGTGSTRK
jgi:hypothetical protein